MDDRKQLYDKCDKELKRVIDWIKEHEDAFDMMDLKLHDAAFFDDWDEFPLIKKAIDQKIYEYGTPYYDFADQSYEQMEEWFEQENIKFMDMVHHVGRTSKFYLHDRNLIDITANGINYENTIDWLVNHFGWPGSFEDNKEGLCDREWLDENWEDDEFVENNVKYIASGEFYDDVTKEFADVLEVYDYIKSFKDDQVNIYKEWLANEEEWLEETHPELTEGVKRMKRVKTLSEKAIKWLKEHTLTTNRVDRACDLILEGKKTISQVIFEGASEEDKKHALLKFLNLDSSPENFDKVKQSSYNDNMYEFEGQEFLVCTDDEADEECKESIMNLIDDLGLESFSKYAQEYIIDNFTDDDPFMEFYKQDVENYAEDIQNEQESGEVEIDGETVEFNNRLLKEVLECGALDPDDMKRSDIDEDGDYVGDEDLVELYCDHFDDPEKQGYDSAAEWFRFNFGDDQFVESAKDWDAIDWDQVAEWSMNEDGRGHELNRWDGHEYEEDFDGETYYIYPQDDYKQLMGD